MKEQRYINDKDFAEGLFIRDKVELNRYGRNRIKSELLKKGISKELIDELLETTFQTDTEYETAKRIGRK